MYETDAAKEKKLFEKFARDYDEAKTYKWKAAGKNHANWDDYEAWENGSKSAQLGNAVTPNLIRPILELLVAEDLGDASMPYYVTQNADDDDTIDILNGLLLSDWNNQGVENEVYRAVYSSGLCGMGYVDPRWSKSRQEVVWESVDPRFYFPSPDADMFLRRASYVIRATLVDLCELMEKYAEAFAWTPGTHVDLATTESMFDPEHVYRIGSPLPKVKIPNPPGLLASVPSGKIPAYASMENFPKAKAVVLEYHCPDVNQHDWLLPEKARRDAKTWDSPAGTFVLCGTKILEMKPDEGLRGEHPATPIGGTLSTGSYYRRGDVEHMVTLQRASDVIHTNIADQVRIATRRPLIVDKDKVGDNLPFIEIEPEAIIALEGGSGSVQPLNIEPSMPSLRFLQYLVEMFYTVTGANRSSSGQKEPGIIAAAAIQQLQQVLVQRRGPRKRLIARGMAIASRKAARLMFKHYDEKHAARDLGEEAAAGWDKIRKSASPRFDVITDYGKMPMFDPENVTKIVFPAITQGLFDKRIAPEQRLEMILPVKDFYPGSDRVIRQINKEIAMAKKAAIEQEKAAESGQPPATPQPEPTEDRNAVLAGAV